MESLFEFHNAMVGLVREAVAGPDFRELSATKNVREQHPLNGVPHSVNIQFRRLERKPGEKVVQPSDAFIGCAKSLIKGHGKALEENGWSASAVPSGDGAVLSFHILPKFRGESEGIPQRLVDAIHDAAEKAFRGKRQDAA